MPPTFPTSYNATELDRILSTLKDTKLTLTFKLNLLRSSATGSPTHLARFNALEDQLVHVGQKIWKLEANFDRNKVGVSLSQKDEYEDVIKHKLKKAMELVGTLDTLGEEIMRLKFTMEAMPAAGSKAAMKFVSAAGAQEGAAGAADASRVNFTSATGAMLSRLLDSTASPQAPPSAAPSSCRGGSSSAANGSASTPPVPGHATNLPAVSNPTDNCPAAKKQKINPVPSTQSSASALKDNEIKQEPNIPKSAKVSNWAPEGYYFVKAHFRRKPKRKAKHAEAERKENNAPASVEIVDLDGV
ncbi:hypothetical protein L207DRAFT_639947 [Hyaloscypha variabilis F]|uniref:Uncharacterized protein n=1 Tax=Hyaloscypha variabilis (strain UAMH 11265 / GT02V1 / F) TaxID=1149755 RepID=A0A2J6R2D2_HYAVF|nr:hypothetical protein L207DRAFT_639947 [Hyaloscypha variabilis F]